MARSRREKTLADYVVIAISPALIMTLVGSLAFFLLEVTYRGQYRERTMWVLFCYVCGAVLVAQIAVEVGKERASLFGGALAAATAVFALQYLDAVLVVCTLLAVIWWCAWKLVFDCTLIDDNEDASGEGLLQAAGFDREENGPSPVKGERQADDAGAPLDSGLEGPPDESKRRPHSPGLWVVYFSLAALPLFGVGQLVIPMAESARRAYAFQLLALYVASALGLLLTTSFLGLRRYLRQRKLQMPPAMTGSWLGLGIGMALTVLAVALLIPRPQGEYALNQLIDKLDAKARQASKVAMLGGDRGEGKGRRIGAQDVNAKQPGDGGNPPEKPNDARNDAQNNGQKDGQKDRPKGGENGEQQKDADSSQSGSDDRSKKAGSGGRKGDKGTGQGEKTSSGDEKTQGNAEAKGGESGDRQGEKSKQRQAEGDAGNEKKQAEQKQAGKDQPDGKQDNPQKNAAKGPAGEPQGKAGGQPPAPPASGLSSMFSTLAASVKWLIYAALTLAGIYLFIRNWARLLAILALMWNELVNLWQSLFGGKRDEGDAGESEEVEAAARLRPFASYENPFDSGADRRMTPAQLAVYTFAALEAWSRETLVPRPPEQTPLEFADALSELRPELSGDVKQTALLYARLVYARKSPTREGVEALARLWSRMEGGGRTLRS